MYLVLDLDQVDLEVPVPLVVLAPLVLVDLVDPEEIVFLAPPNSVHVVGQKTPVKATANASYLVRVE